MTPSAAIVIPNFNGETFIMETIRLLTIGLPNIKIIVIDDNSTDSSVDLLKSNSIEVVQRSVNGGFAATVNTGLRYLQSRGLDFALICNSDLVPSVDECNNIRKSFLNIFQDPTVGVVGYRERNAFIPKTEDSSDISGFLFWIKLDLLNRVGFLDERFYMYGEETDFFRRIVANGYKIKQSNVLVSHAVEKSAKSKMKNSWYAIRNCIFLEVKDFRLKEAFIKSAALILIMFGLLGHPDDPSTKRIRRSGLLLGPLMLVAAVLWNVYQLFKILTKREHR